MNLHRLSGTTSDVIRVGARIAGAAVGAAILAFGLSCGATARAASSAAGSAATSGFTQDNSKSATRLQFFLQKRFRLASPSDVRVGQAKPSKVKGLLVRKVRIRNERGQKAMVLIYTDKAETRAILSDVVVGPVHPGPLHGLWTRALRPASAPPHSPAKSELITDSPAGTPVLGSVIDLTKDPWGRIDVKKLHLKDRATQGPADAPVTIIEFGDFECPFCARAFGDIETVVNTTYKGKVKLIFKNFPLSIHPWATQAAIAGECVRRQNPKDFWTFAHDIYRDQGEITPANLRQHITTYMGQMGLDDKLLDACIEGSQAEAQVNQDRRDGNAIGVNSTPTFLINGIEVVGLPSSKAFRFVVDSELERSRKKH